MKKSIAFTLFTATILSFTISCVSVPPANTDTSVQETQTKKTSKPKELKVINSSSVPAAVQETSESLYEKKIKGLKLITVSYPKETQKGHAFDEPFVFEAKNADGKAVVGLELCVSYPDTRVEGRISYSTATLTTDSSGKITFFPATPTNSFNSNISAFPAGDVTNPAIAKLAGKVSVSAPYKVRTNLAVAGGTISIVDFNAQDKPILNNSISSSNVLVSLIQKGFKRVGNADFSNEILKDEPARIFNVAKNLLGNTSVYLVYGTVKYASQVEKTQDNKYTLTLKGKITCLDMKDGSILCTAEESATVIEDKEWNCINSARKELAQKFADDIYYGL
ncbi:hypothetical protein [Treponema pectinovorum]|uniref:hypothetical protein n=1 Tax=Treponema pectinovorum TaxID=164 RepID=UPI0011CA26DE|nr:hypothetical protein [Treponema pectinovorum]